jgi:hypothetical protein
VVKNIIIVALLIVVMFLSTAVVRVENQRYALQNDMCRKGPENIAVDFQCLENVETRTSWLWHLWYALVDYQR